MSRNQLLGSFFGISLLFFLFNYELIDSDSRMLKDNFYYALPFFTYILQSFSATGDFPLWNMYTNHGEPTFLFLNNNYLLHLPYIPFYFFAKFISDIDPIKVFWSAMVLANYLQAICLAYLLFLITKSKKIFIYALIISLFSGIAIGQMHQMQINASSLYLIITTILFILWFNSEKKIYWYLASFILGCALLNHYPHLVVYLLLSITLPLYFFHKPLYKEILTKISNLGLFHIALSAILFLLVSSPIFILYFSYVDHYSSPFRGESLLSNYEYLQITANSNSMNIHTILHYVFPKVFFKTHLGQSGPNNLIWYIGLLPLIFSIYFLFTKNKSFTFLKMTIFIVFFLGLGAHSFGYFILYKIFPFAEMQRLPAHFASYLTPLLIIASSIGLNSFISHKFKFNLTFFNTKFYLISFLLLLLFTASIIYLLRIYDLQVVRYFMDDLIILIFSIVIFVWLLFNLSNKYFWLVLFSILIIDLGSFAHRNLSVNLQKSTESEYKNLPTEDDYFIWRDQADHFLNFAPGKVYQSLIFGRMFFDIEQPLLLNKEYKNFIKKYDLISKEGATSKKFNLKKQLYWLPDHIDGEEDIMEYIRSNESSFDYESINHFPNSLSLKLNAQSKGKLLWINNYDAHWSLKLNNISTSINKLGPFMMVEIDEGLNDLIFEFDPPWGYIIRFIYLGYLFIPILLLTNFFYCRKYKLLPQ